MVPGRNITLLASAARTDGATGAGVSISQYSRLVVLLKVTAAATEVGDLLDVYLDVLGGDGSTWINAGRFTQVLGNGGAKTYAAVFEANTPGTSIIDVSADLGSAGVRPTLLGDQMRARWAITDAGPDNASFTFAVTAYGK